MKHTDAVQKRNEFRNNLAAATATVRQQLEQFKNKGAFGLQHDEIDAALVRADYANALAALDELCGMTSSPELIAAKRRLIAVLEAAPSRVAAKRDLVPAV